MVLKVIYTAQDVTFTATHRGTSWTPSLPVHFGSQVASPWETQHQRHVADWQKGYCLSKHPPVSSEAEEIISLRKERRWYWPSASSGADFIGLPQQSGVVRMIRPPWCLIPLVPGSMSPLIGSSNLVLCELNLKWWGRRSHSLCLVPRFPLRVWVRVCVAVTHTSSLPWLTTTVWDSSLCTGICMSDIVSTWQTGVQSGLIWKCNSQAASKIQLL